MNPSSGELSTASASGSRRSLLVSSYALATNTVVTSALGVCFWIVAARLFSTTEVGRDTVLISAMVELSTLCQLNLGNGIVRFLPGIGKVGPRVLIGAYLAATGLAVPVGSAFVLLAPRATSELGFLGTDPGLQLAFVVSLALWGIFALQDAALTATRRAVWVPVENAGFGVLKLATLPILAGFAIDHGIFFAWALPTALLVGPVNWVLFRHALIEETGRGEAQVSPLERFGRRRAARFLAQDYLASIFTQATLTVLPILVLAVLGASASAYFAIPFMIVVSFDTLAYGTCAALVVEAAREEQEVRELGRLFARRVIAPLVPLTVILIALSPILLRLFGSAYAAHGTTTLRLLLAASLLRLCLALFGALCRVHGQGLRIAAVELFVLVSVLGLAIPLANGFGIRGVAFGWLIANLLAAVGVTPSLVGKLRG